MSGPTKIEWAEGVWNPITGCTKVSAGCAHCYAERMATRLAGRAGYPAEHPFAVTLHPDRLEEPLHWRKPRRIFVCSMSDLFHPDVPDEFTDWVFQTMDQARWHTFVILTKRPERMRAYVIERRQARFREYADKFRDCPTEAMRTSPAAKVARRRAENPMPAYVWLGTSVEDQATADDRIPHLLRCPAAVRFVSYEPVLGPVDLSRSWDPLKEPEGARLPGKIDWVIAGGESGPKARACHIEDIRSVVRQCREGGVSVFVKQLGSYPSSDQPEGMWWEPLWEDKTCTRLSGRYAPTGGLAQKGGNRADWPEDLRIREYPDA